MKIGILMLVVHAIEKSLKKFDRFFFLIIIVCGDKISIQFMYATELFIHLSFFTL